MIKGGGCVDKYKRLVSNTLLFAITPFLPKYSAFFLTAYRTRDDGHGRLRRHGRHRHYRQLFIPLVSLGIANAIIRFGLEKGEQAPALYQRPAVHLCRVSAFVRAGARAELCALYPRYCAGHWVWLRCSCW